MIRATGSSGTYAAAIERRRDKRKADKMVFFHCTTNERAQAILDGGFKDSRGYYLTDRIWEGVWFSVQPLDVDEGAKGDMLLRVDLAVSEKDIEQWEWIEEGKPYREWMMPAAFVNAHTTTIEVVNDDDL